MFFSKKYGKIPAVGHDPFFNPNRLIIVTFAAPNHNIILFSEKNI